MRQSQAEKEALPIVWEVEHFQNEVKKLMSDNVLVIDVNNGDIKKVKYLAKTPLFTIRSTM